jgi:hypothetical protein
MTAADCTCLRLPRGLTKRCEPAVLYFYGFKWIWLNRGYIESLVDIQVTLDPVFADQRFALAYPQASDPAERGTPGTDTSKRRVARKT